MIGFGRFVTVRRGRECRNTLYNIGFLGDQRRATDSSAAALATAIRIHGNASEYIPPVLIGLLALAFLEAPVWSLHTIGIAFTVARLLHVIGMGGGPLVMRQLGIALSWTVMVSVSLALLYFAFT